MSAHLYQVGDLVSLNFDDGQFFSRLNPFPVEAQMPHLGSRLQYRIKSRSENFGRVVPEHQINVFGAQPNTQPIIALGVTAPQRVQAASRSVDIVKGSA